MSNNTGLPSTWHEVRHTYDQSGPVLYWRRENTGYEVWPEYGRFSVYLDARRVSQHDTLTHAIVGAREHMHANSTEAS